MTSRDFALAAGAAGLGAGLLGYGPNSVGAEPPPETTSIRFTLDPRLPVLCWAPQYLAIDFLRMESFTDVDLRPFSGGSNNAQVLANNKGATAVTFCRPC